MSKRRSIASTRKFYHEYQGTNPSLVLGLIIISLGLYMINWIYVKNKEFEDLDVHAPEAQRGAVILMIIPFTWFFISKILGALFFSADNPLFQSLNSIAWALIAMLVLKYFFDFCLTFGRITRTNGLVWFTFFSLGLIGVLGLLLWNFYLIPLLLFLVISIPAMQSEMNSFFLKFAMKREKSTHYN